MQQNIAISRIFILDFKISNKVKPPLWVSTEHPNHIGGKITDAMSFGPQGWMLNWIWNKHQDAKHIEVTQTSNI